MGDLLGAHVSIAGGAHRAFARGEKEGCDAIQIFTSSNMAWHVKQLSDEDVARFKEAREKSSIEEVVAHDSYLVNLCSGDAETAKRSLGALAEELIRCERLGVERLVMHPGAHTGRGTAAGLKAVAQGIDDAVERAQSERVRILLEITAGSGTVLGSRFEQLADIIGMSRYGKRLGICFDTAHALGAGYDLRTREGYDKVMDELDGTVGLDRVGCFHLNDSKWALGSRVDRHEHIGKGTLGLEAFRLILNDTRFAGVPKVIETPKGKSGRRSWDRVNLEILRGLVAGGKRGQRTRGN